MAITYYDDAIKIKLEKWLPENSKLRVLGNDETKRLFETMADDKKDAEFKLPFIGISRNNDVELLSTIKNNRSYDGLKITNNQVIDDDGNREITNELETMQLNAIPIRLAYQLDIYTKTATEGNEYLRSFLFKLINNPELRIIIPYNNANLENRCYLRVLSNVSNTSSIAERLYAGQFTRWTIQLEIQDAYFFNIPYRKNWKVSGVCLEVSEDITLAGEEEEIEVESDE